MKKTLPTLLHIITTILLIAPSQVWAASVTAQEEMTPAFWVVLSMAVVTSLIALWSVLRRRDALIRANEAEAIIQFSDAVLEEGSLAYFTIHNGTTCYCSPRLRRWLGFSESIIPLEKLEQAGLTATQDKEITTVLFDKIRTLVKTGESFTNTFSPPNMDRIYLVRGTKAKNDLNKNRQFDVIWFNNVTELDQGHSNLTAQLSESLSKQMMLSQILDVAPFPVWSRNKNLSLGWVNRSYATAVEKENSASVVAAQAELVIDAKKRPLQEIAKRALAKHQEQVEKHFVTIDGQRHSLQVHEVPSPNNEFETIGFAIDVTRAEFLDAELGQHKAAHAETLDKLSTPVAIFGPDTTLRFYNHAFNQLWQLPAKWLDGEPTHSELLEAWRQKRQLPEHADYPAWKKHILSQYVGLLEPTEETWHLPNGRTLRVVTQPHPIGGILVLFEDVTDRLELERSYNTLIEVQRETLNNLHESVAVFGSDGRLKLFNSNYAKLWQIDPEFLNAEPHIKEITEKTRVMLDNSNQNWEVLQDNLINITASRELHSGQWTLSNGTVVEYSIVPLPDGACLFTISDETSKAKITAALEDRNLAMKAADRLKSEFIASMSYELRTPLNSIIGFSEILNLENFGSLNPRQKDYIDAILSSSVKLKYLIDDILDLSIIEADKMELDIEEVDIKTAIEKAMSMSQETAQSKGVNLSLTKGRVADTSVEGDLRRITQAIHTIITDGISRTGTDGSVKVEMKGNKKTISICISDTKPASILTDEEESSLIGIANEQLTNRKLNLSLSLVESFIKIHGGELSVSNNKNGVRTVVCALPRKNTMKRPAVDA
ncbi:MAG: PAS-domain containing protein [Sphingomonadales bacterium]|nr:PAS-domain containing protein [Sphingomonadales bacterium]